MAENKNLKTVRRLRRSELPVETIALAQFLIGKIVVRELASGVLAGRIVETEAYPPRDPAAHHFRGQTPRNGAMFGPPGHAYVYFSYGNHFMLNVTSEREGVGGGILIRALQPLLGIEQMQLHRKRELLTELTSGPGRLAAALRIDRKLDGVDLCAAGELWLGEEREQQERDASPLFSGRSVLGQIRRSRRIGITRAAHRLLRFYEKGSPFVSGPPRLRV